ncbi:hypothetical protein [Nocardia sp. BSTN01]|uniref:hypothetical protein n=1 Tax=Nocardia sp. BSTN01 TaxID=2783665 RepID=UPI0035CD3D0F
MLYVSSIPSPACLRGARSIRRRCACSCDVLPRAIRGSVIMAPPSPGFGRTGHTPPCLQAYYPGSAVRIRQMPPPRRPVSAGRTVCQARGRARHRAEDAGRVEVRADLVGDQRDDRQMESAVSRLSLAPSVTSVGWRMVEPVTPGL